MVREGVEQLKAHITPIYHRKAAAAAAAAAAETETETETLNRCSSGGSNSESKRKKREGGGGQLLSVTVRQPDAEHEFSKEMLEWLAHWLKAVLLPAPPDEPAGAIMRASKMYINMSHAWFIPTGYLQTDP